ncbi:TniQ family protein [Mycolicibacterium sp. CBMA 226]|uniref:TniQ family protein n=1 Tax=Mycolicibacterium sp. CBMA 226 TaxID=2606611 RepID=UPI0012DEC5BB|nr:TniQ family protein [Mycolicibacterium sp. CBMA 226]MUL78966.1 LysR family transcriptional regulator [Mycolicibacterium sp. CBMA 226]QGW61277.1 hypothetical protein ICEMyc226_00245 [Mycolicibacterium sp.]
MRRVPAPPREPATIRTLPRVTAPAPGESLDSWLEATAVRLGVTVRDVYAAMGFASPFSELWRHINRQLTDAEAEAIAAATSRAPQQVRNMTLSRYRDLAGIDDAGRFTGAAPWARVHGSRFCPECLAASGGVWLLRWRLVWTFACTRHHCLLADHCPRCGDAQRYRYRVGPDAPHPGQCANPALGTVGSRRPRCDADLGEAPVLQLPVDHPALAAQATIDALIDGGAGAFGVYAEHPLPAMAILADIRALGAGLLRAANAADLDRIVPGDLADHYHVVNEPGPSVVAQARGRRGERRFREKPPLAIDTAVAVTAALTVLNRPTVADAADALVALHPHLDRAKLEYNITKNRPVSGSASPVLRAVYTVSLGARLTPAHQLQFRVGTPLAGRPPRTATRCDRRVAGVPALLWPAWALRLCPPGMYQRHVRPALSVALLLVGATLTITDSAAALGNATNCLRTVILLGTLHRTPQWPQIRAALIRLSDYLDTVGVPIDYRRRRQLDYTHLLPDAHWRDIACGAYTRPEGAAVARRFLRERLSGSPAIATPVPLSAEVEYAALLKFPGRLNPRLLDALDRHGADFLAAQGITDEPVWWEPPIELLADLDLPGIDTETIDIAELHRLLRREQCSLIEAAAAIGTTPDAVRGVLEHHPAPKEPRPASKPKIGPHRPGPAYIAASTMFPRDRLVELYQEQHVGLRTLGAMAGVCKQTMAALICDYGIPLRPSGQGPGLQVDGDWLYTEHVERGRSLSDLAGELGVTGSVLTKWVKIHQIPVRAPARRTAEELSANHDIPRILLLALAGRGGWERLQRFAAIVDYADYATAARELHASASVLALQMRILERDLGDRLLDRADGTHPMHITEFGLRVQRAVRHLASLGGP